MPDLSSPQTGIKPYENRPLCLSNNSFLPTLKLEEPLLKVVNPIPHDFSSFISEISRQRQKSATAINSPPTADSGRLERNCTNSLNLDPPFICSLIDGCAEFACPYVCTLLATTADAAAATARTRSSVMTESNIIMSKFRFVVVDRNSRREAIRCETSKK
jgi:hypothetical protein